jgi:hypothetical protein
MKNLVYYNVSLKDEYSQLVKLSIEKLDKTNPNLYDVLIITTEEFFQRNFVDYKRKNLFFHFVSPSQTSMDVTFKRFEVFNYEFISEYENILYVDSDIWINLNLESIFNQCVEDNKLYAVVEDYRFENHLRTPFSVESYTEKDIQYFRENKIYTFNSGLLMFKSSYLMEKHFSNVLKNMELNSDKSLYDQSFLNQYFNTLNLTNTNVIVPGENYLYIVESNITENLNIGGKICHFLDNTFDGKTKLNTIMNYNKETKYEHRDDLIDALPSLIGNGKGVEIGVFKGHFSKVILSKWGGTLYMVDVWRGLGDEYEDMSNHNNHSDAFLNAMKNIEGTEDRGVMIRATSKVASEIFEDESLDFVYIDANHAYDFVVEDINLWFPKLKKGGVFAGHDYLDMDWNADPNFCPNGKDKYIYTNTYQGTQYYNGIFGVNPAVDEFCKEHNYEVNVTKEWFGTWWFIK